MTTFRLVVCIDIEAKNLSEAYGKLWRGMAVTMMSEDWESSDEWYGEDGELGSEEELAAARMAFFQTLPEEPA